MKQDRWYFLLSKMRAETLTIPEIEELDAELEKLRDSFIEKHESRKNLIASLGHGLLLGMKMKLEQKAKA